MVNTIIDYLQGMDDLAVAINSASTNCFVGADITATATLTGI